LFPSKPDSFGAFSLRRQICRAGKPVIFLPHHLQFDLIGLQLLGVSGGFVNQDLPLLPPHGRFKVSLPLRGFVTCVMPPIVCDAVFVFLPHLLQLCGAILLRRNAHNDRVCRVPAVKRADTTHKIVIERRIRRVAVLPSLYRLMIWRAVAVVAPLAGGRGLKSTPV